MNRPAALVLSPASPPNELALFPPGTRLHEGRLSSGLHVRWYELGDPDKPAALFVHGFPELAVSWTHQFAALADSYRVIALDTRGCGGTEAPWLFWSYTLRRAAKDCVELLDLVGVERAHLVGHDMGTAIAWEAVQNFPASFRSLSIVNGPCLPLMFRNAHKQAAPSSYIWNMFVPFWFSSYARRDPERMLRDAFHRDAEHERVFTPDVIEAYAKHIRRRGVPAVNYYRAFAVFPTFRLKPVHMPVRLIWGEHDPWVGKFFSEPATYAKFVSDIDAVIVEGKGHFVQQQAPEPVNAALREHWTRADAAR
ncbi:MAG: epoxide hydrolase 4-like [Myxococcaceae bacterium]|nr:epoxide hydrolase 4-like [Myxococcaceae bacterium]